jgi:hypothetical protein
MRIKEAVELLGGPTAVANELKVNRRTVTEWGDKNKVGDRSILGFINLCKKYGVKISIYEVSGK